MGDMTNALNSRNLNSSSWNRLLCSCLPTRPVVVVGESRRHFVLEENIMSIAKVIEITAQSSESFDDAVAQGIKQASKTVDDIKSAWVKEMKVSVENGEVNIYRVILKVTFKLN